MSKLAKVAILAGMGAAILQAVVTLAIGWEQLHPKEAK